MIDQSVIITFEISEHKTYLSTLDVALKSDMKNGHAKLWLSELFKTLMSLTKDFSSGDLMHLGPSFHDNTNTQIEILYGDLENENTNLHYYEPYCASPQKKPPEPSIESISLFEDLPVQPVLVERFTLVPDYILMLSEFPGMFPLVVELKPRNKHPTGAIQNLEQMISKMFYQDVVFGLVVTPVNYILSMLIKKGNELKYFTTSGIALTTLGDTGYNLKLDTNNLNKMITFIFDVIRWSIKSKCMLKRGPESKT